MTRYYASCKPFTWLRKKLKITKPHALPLGGWEKWEAELKTQRPVAYWLTETLPDWLEKPAEWFLDPVSDAKYYVRNRWITQTHVLKTGLKPGQYHELSERMLHGLFTELVEFVEVEKAHMQVIWGNKADRTQYGLPWWRRIHWFRWSQWRSAEAGLDYLKWESELINEASCYTDPDDPAIGQPTSQALDAQETLELYHWWKQVRPLRPDPMEVGGWSSYCEQMQERYGSFYVSAEDRTSEEQEQSHRALAETTAVEQSHSQEDQDMMIRLIKIRESLWT